MVSRCDAEEKEIFKVPEKRDQGWLGAPEEVSHVREEPGDRKYDSDLA